MMIKRTIRKKSRRFITVLAVFMVVLLLAAVCRYYFFRTEKMNYFYAPTDEAYYNPLMGFAVNADYEEAVGENTLVYVEITWRDWEPEEGRFAVEAVKEENRWEQWRQAGKRVVLRFLCDDPGDEGHMDIPDWLYERTGNGVFYDHDYGKGYSPEYHDEVFIEAHERAVLALGEAFGGDGMVAYIELGSLGHWGEWHMLYTAGTTRMPSSRVRARYVAPYQEAFPNARLLARRPFAETAALGLGLYNDMTGDPSDTREWLSWISSGGVYSQPEEKEELVPQPEVWRTAPVGGEFTSGISFEELLESELPRTLELLRASHTTFIGPKCPVREKAKRYREGVDEVLKTIGYRYGVRKCAVERRAGSVRCSLSLTVENRGTAPIYFPWDMYLYVYGGDGALTERLLLPVNLMELFGGERAEAVLTEVPWGDDFIYGVGIEDPDTDLPAVWLDMEGERNGMVSLLGNFS